MRAEPKIETAGLGIFATASKPFVNSSAISRTPKLVRAVVAFEEPPVFHSRCRSFIVWLAHRKDENAAGPKYTVPTATRCHGRTR